MDKSLNKNVFKLLFCFVLFFSFTIGVSADDNFIKITTDNIYNNCNKDNKCIPMCIYGDQNGEKVLIGYHYADKTWEIAFRKQGLTKDDQLLYSIDDHMPKDHIQYEKYNDAKKLSVMDWQGSDGYNKLLSDYKCPSFVYLQPINNKLCFQDNNSQELCTKREDGTVGYGQDYKFGIKYQFTGEYANVSKAVYDDLFIQQIDDDEAKNKHKLEFLHSIDSDIKYDSSKNAKDNAIDNCSYIKENTEAGKLNEYMKKVAGSKEKFVSEYINPSFATNANNNLMRNFINNSGITYYKFDDISFYDYNVLYGMMVENNDSSGNSDNMKFKNVAVMTGAHANNQIGAQPAFRYIYDLFGNNVTVSVNYIVSMCGEEGIVIDAPSTNDALIEAKKELGLYVYQDPQISFKDEYDCSFLTDVAGIIGDAYFILEMAGLAILVVLSVMDYLKVFLSDNADELKKVNSRFIKRLIVAVALFLLPALVNFSLRIFKIEGINSDHPLCVQISNK